MTLDEVLKLRDDTLQQVREFHEGRQSSLHAAYSSARRSRLAFGYTVTDGSYRPEIIVPKTSGLAYKQAMEIRQKLGPEVGIAIMQDGKIPPLDWRAHAAISLTSENAAVPCI